MENLSLNKGDSPWLSNIIDLVTGILDLTRRKAILVGHSGRANDKAHDTERQTPVSTLVLIKEDGYYSSSVTIEYNGLMKTCTKHK